ncbi:BTAD domain-containing putative transcriptional regulator [Actinomadura sp. 9N215]|uniref:AfsR/SARP family transcriptional regulator n=1 Tax=Actinomadura sp. 9N215 TaxID=3375150 RepID=UPI00379DA2BE
MEFRILGPLEVQVVRRVQGDFPPRLATLLSGLLLNANRIVLTEELIDQVWGDAMPAKPMVALQMAVSRLRRMLRCETSGGARIITRQSAYLLSVEPDRLDLASFDRLVRQARLAAADDPEAAVMLYRQGLGYWRGPALADVSLGSAWRAMARRLDERRLRALHDRIELDMSLNRHSGLVPELTSLTGVYPFDERMYHHLMIALYATGRRAEALQTYGKARSVLVSDLGIEPGEKLRTLQRIILSNEHATIRAHQLIE